MSVPSPPRTQALSSATFVPPPLDSLLTLPEVYDWHLSHSGKHPLFIYADGCTGTTEVLWSEGVQAIHRAAYSMNLRITRDDSESSAPVVAIFAVSGMYRIMTRFDGASDTDTISYFCTMMGIMRAGFPVFLISPKLSPTALTHVLSMMDVAHVVVEDDPVLQDTLTASIKGIYDQHPERKIGVSSMLKSVELFSADIPTLVSLPPVRFHHNSLALITHTSGTTTLPKLVRWTHSMLMQQMWIPWYGERDMTGEILACHAIPTYGPSGVMQAVFTASCGLIISPLKPTSPPTVPTSENIFQGMLNTKSTFTFVVPPLLDVWSRDPAKLVALKSLKGVLYTGGPLNKEVGDKLSEQGINLFTLFASSENGVMNRVFTRSVGKEWEWFTFSPHCHPEFKLDTPGSAELILKSCPSHTPSIINSDWDGAPAYATNDLLVEHPEKLGYYKFVGRADDQIVLSTGEKMNAGAFERILVRDPLVAGAVIFSRRPIVGVIIEPVNSHVDMSGEDISAFKDAIWPTVERVNNIVPMHGRISRQMTIVALPSKPFTYGVKGAPRRKNVVADYKTEIEALIHPT